MTATDRPCAGLACLCGHDIHKSTVTDMRRIHATIREVDLTFLFDQILFKRWYHYFLRTVSDLRTSGSNLRAIICTRVPIFAIFFSISPRR